MPVQVIENWARLSGTIKQIERQSHVENWWTIYLEVVSVEPVPNFPSLFGSDMGNVICLIIPARVVEQLNLAVGQRLSCRARKTGPGISFAQPETITVD